MCSMTYASHYQKLLSQKEQKNSNSLSYFTVQNYGPNVGSVDNLKSQKSDTLKNQRSMNNNVTKAHSDKIRHHKNFRYRVDTPKHPSGELIVLLHGSGGDDTTLFSFARPLWPNATLLGIRGRFVQDGENRWYRKITATKFDQNQVVDEADAFVDFLMHFVEKGHYDLSQTTFVGYSNGANLLAVIMLENPDLIHRAILMRSMPVLDDMPSENLQKTDVLTISGKNDKIYARYAPVLSSLLRDCGARVDSEMVDADHMIGKEDAAIIRKWIEQKNHNQ
ncbi:hypothetical protein MEG_01098 [Bartonella tamiae Th307]|uniref:Phospholipase/carboxylesterase/thioesterase domain-containing protein n=2 Tax=Bartonella tamiae TaxID=373638 RepID=J1JZ37_9HYPH|nr:alpha/beta hydrolase [Bartonella tamiae]EJF90382.1 hypothetical protein ME5_00783 [Bartonella tamiae Th239]EJF93674.1 hypothetical protein MEG_01098 [Bartonella tamiae Th307]